MMNDVEMSLNANTPEPERAEPAGSCFPSYRVDRNKRDPQPSHYALLDRFGMVKLHRHSKLDAGPLQRAFRNAAGRRSFLPDEERLIGEGLGGDVATSSPGVLGRHDENEF